MLFVSFDRFFGKEFTVSSFKKGAYYTSDPRKKHQGFTAELAAPNNIVKAIR